MGKYELLSVEENRKLYTKWGKKSAVLSLKQVKQMLEAYKLLGIKDDRDCLIFDTQFCCFRRIGEQYQYHMVVEKKRARKKEVKNDNVEM